MAEKTKKPGFFSRYVGGLLGEDVESMTPEERRRANLSVLGIIARGMGSPEAGSEALALTRASRAAERKAADDARRTAAAEARMPDITSRIFGGLTGTTIEALPGAGGEAAPLAARRVPTSAGARQALGMLYGTPAGRDVAQMSPGLAEFAKEGALGRTVGGSVYDPLTGRFTRPPEAQVQTLTPQEVARLGLPRGTLVQRDPGGELKILREPPRMGAGGGAPGAEGGGGAGVPGAPPAVKLSADERKAIREMRGVIQASSDSISGLELALELSPQAYEGVGAAARAAASSALPGSQADAEATIEFDLILKQQVLPQLKTTFGAAPTEGERKILLELQGSASLPRPVRERLLRRAIDMARAKMAANEEDVNAMLSGTYYLPPSTPAAATPAAAPPVSAPQADFVFQNGRLVPVKK
jgi:hypothetical protein